MCGRFTLYSSGESVAEAFDLSTMLDLQPRYNVEPAQQVAVVRATPEGQQLAWLKWGLLPAWVKDKKLAPINAMAETAATKPFFRSAMKKRRCLVPADGWFEWQQLDAKRKQPYYFGSRDGKPLAFAGLWETWEHEGEALDTFAILTTDANEIASPVHNRMPVILPASAYDRWLDPANQDTASLQDLLRPYPAEVLFARQVSTLVNKLQNDDPRCIEGVDA
jgi:putative SOS response-associated peptidase YedK